MRILLLLFINEQVLRYKSNLFIISVYNILTSGYDVPISFRISCYKLSWAVGEKQESLRRKEKARGKIFTCLFDVEGRKTNGEINDTTFRPIFSSIYFLKIVVRMDSDHGRNVSLLFRQISKKQWNMNEKGNEITC